jgi:uncharacterized membrane protein
LVERAPYKREGACSSQAPPIRINDHGQIVGYYSETSPAASGDVRGFLLEPGKFKQIDVPGLRSTIPGDVNNREEIVGSYVDAEGILHGFRLGRRGDFTDIDVPGAAGTQVVGLNDRNQMVGVYFDAGGALRGFRRDADGSVTTIDPPRTMRQDGRGIALGPVPYGINNRGQIVGAYRDDQFQIYGFKLEGGRFTAIKISGARGESFATDIDDGGRIIGIDR